jgi:non-specific protein-tyrosine kinase
VKTLLVRAITASLLVAAVVYTASFLPPPTYEASALMVVDQKEQSYGRIHPIPNAPLGVFAQTVAMDIESPLVAEEAIDRVGLEVSWGELLDNLTARQVDSSRFIRLNHTDTDPERAAVVANTVGLVSSGRISNASAADSVTASLFDKASVPDAPASPKPLRNGLLALVVALVLSAALIEARRRVRLNEERER